MDLFKQVNNQIKKIRQDSSINAHRYKENFPQIERKSDEVSFDNKYTLEFKLSDHPHTVKLNFRVKPPTTCFRCNAPVNTGHFGDIQGRWSGISFPSMSGTSTPAQWSTLVENDGGFIKVTDGIIVPEDGVYNCQFILDASGVTTNEAAALIFSVRHNGVILSQRVYTISNGRLPVPPTFFSLDNLTFNGLCVQARAGDIFNGYGAASFLSPLSIGGGSINVYRVALL